MANERTLLSYIRTSLTLIVTDAGILQFIQDGLKVLIVGWALILIGLYFFFLGFIRYRRLFQSLKKTS